MSKIIESLSWIDSIAGFVWLVLSGIMIYILFRIKGLEGTKNKYFSLGVFLLVIVWLYPLYTGFYSSLEIGAVGNVFTLGVTLWHLIRLKELDRRLSSLMIPQIIWLSVATFYVSLMILDK
ncbi:MAG: tryptophan-rich sensory protein [Bacteroidota bacterium]